ncbi:hypothetical protein N656DRAFT_340078 [Canariomyces notabilis]|uniref:Uncharacterized protein n=1 Tax=Canariomyces notabilis TaxID=2074819 RepID=A0AAN6QIL2_9PEZI|nr:hypothetical protein N656DRAFT_340078 [Canariomyces arenarius]
MRDTTRYGKPDFREPADQIMAWQLRWAFSTQGAVRVDGLSRTNAKLRDSLVTFLNGNCPKLSQPFYNEEFIQGPAPIVLQRNEEAKFTNSHQACIVKNRPDRAGSVGCCDDAGKPAVPHAQLCAQKIMNAQLYVCSTVKCAEYCALQHQSSRISTLGSST